MTLIIFPISLDLHLGHVKSEKCEFKQHSIHFLGLIILPEGVQMDSQKVSAIMDRPSLTDKKGGKAIRRICKLLQEIYQELFRHHHPWHTADQTEHSLSLDP